MKACVYKIHSDFYYVKLIEGNHELKTCKLREVIKKQKIKIKVGDIVEIEESGAIVELLPRKNTLERPSVSNLDLIVVVSSLLEPDLDLIQLNRYLTFLKYHNIPVLLCFNKDDLLNKQDLEKTIEEIKNTYEPLGYNIVFTSALLNEGMEEFKKYIEGKTIAFTGLSGVGKSSVLNSLTENSLRVGEVSKKNKRGCHTTRHSEIIEFENTKIIDTPGFSRLTFDFLLPKDLCLLFDDINSYSKSCKYSDCLHTKDSLECNVVKNLDKINSKRYESYLKFLDETKSYKQKVTFESQKEESGVKINKDKNYAKISSKKRSFSRKRTKQNIKFEGE